jgi:hypothetical protein
MYGVRLAWAQLELITLKVIGTEGIGSCKKIQLPHCPPIFCLLEYLMKVIPHVMYIKLDIYDFI